MMRTIVRTVAAACLLAGSTTQAAYYSSRWDPLSMIVNVVIETNCSGSSEFVWANTGGAGGCSASLYSVVATLNNVDGTPLDPPRYIDFIVPAGFNGQAQAVTDPNADDVILGLYFGPTGLAGILWDASQRLGRQSETPDLVGEGPWKLSFLNTPDFASSPWDLWRSIAILWDCHRSRNCLNVEDTADLIFQDFDSTEVYFAPLGDAPPTTYRRDGSVDRNGNVIPEPGSLALLAGALGAGWVTRRRRSAR